MAPSERFTRRGLLLGASATASFAAGTILFNSLPASRAQPGNLGQSLPSGPLELPPLNENGIITALTICNDIDVAVTYPMVGNARLQTNGVVLCIDLAVARDIPDLTRVKLTVRDLGHGASGAEVDHVRLIEVRDELRGPVGTADYVDAGPSRILLVLGDPLYNQDGHWRTTIDSVEFLDGWLPGRNAEAMAGEQVERLDTLAYPPFPVRPISYPFRRVAIGELYAFEVSGMSEWGRDNGMFARVEAWAVVGGASGPVAESTAMTASIETPPEGTPSRLQAPVYTISVSTAGLNEGVGEIRYKVFPFVGPPWSSADSGEDFPSINPVKGVPFCNDLSDSWAPVHGIVSQAGVGLAGGDVTGLALSIEAAVASGLLYKDCAALAAAVRTLNASPVDVMTASGPLRRLTPHNDIAAGVAVLRSVPGSVAGINFGAYVVGTSFSSQTAYPPGATCFEIRSETGLPDAAIRLRGVNSAGVAMASGTKHVPSRLLLRGVWLDGTGTTSSQNVVIDGSAAGASTKKPTANGCAYLVTVDSVITENPGAGSAAPSRFRAGYVWDVRLRTEGNTGAMSSGTVSAFAGIVSSLGCSYAATQPLRRFPLTGMFGTRLRNLGIGDREVASYPVPTSRLALNVRIDFDRAFTTQAIKLGSSHGSIGGLGLGNVFCRALVDSSGPLISIGADGTLFPLDNVIMRYLGSDLLGTARANNGRANLLYQDAGAVRIDKIGTTSFSAFRSYNCKGDTFMSEDKVSTLSRTFVPGQSYRQGAIVHDTLGAASYASRFYQAITASPALAGLQPAALSDASIWFDLGYLFGKTFGQQPMRQGNLRFRYHVGSHGNVACSTYNGAVFPGTASGYGIRWGRDESVPADYSRFYLAPFSDDYRPQAGSDAPLVNRVPQGAACLPFDLANAPRLNDGSGAAGAYERV